MPLGDSVVVNHVAGALFHAALMDGEAEMIAVVPPYALPRF
jgi:hypothetical protein